MKQRPQRAFEPQLCHLVDKPPTGPGWLHEPKWDGYRLLTTCEAGRVRLWSRNGLEWTDKVPEIARALEGLGAESMQLDGELIALLRGRSGDFNALQARLSGSGHAKLSYVVFDLLALNGHDLTGYPLQERKRALHALFERNHSALVREGPCSEGDGPKRLERALAQGHEGLVSKRSDAPYRGGRSDAWRKCRPRNAEALVIVGFTQPRRSRVGLGALALGRRTADGKWAYAGRVGAGLRSASLRELAAALPKLAQKAPTVTSASLRAAGKLPGVTWVQPKYVVDIEHHGIGNHGLLRQPSVKAVRLDKTVADLDAEGDHGVGVALTHGDRVVFEAPGLTKADVFTYYRAAARWILPEIERRPLSLVRCPSGVSRPCFFQKHVGRGLGEHVLGAPIEDADGRTQSHVYVTDETGLLELVQMNAIELHPWGTRIDDPGRCDRLVFDLDPAEDVTWPEVVRAAILMHKVLHQAGLTAFVRTSGGKGLHVVVPLAPGAPWHEAKAFSRRLAEAMATAQPDRFIAVMTKRKRTGKIFIDYLRNARGATSVASYSLRRNPNATVAMPLTWRELPKVRGPQAYDLRSAMKRLARLRRDPWAGIDETRQALPKLG